MGAFIITNILISFPITTNTFTGNLPLTTGHFLVCSTNVPIIILHSSPAATYFLRFPHRPTSRLSRRYFLDLTYITSEDIEQALSSVVSAMTSMPI